jgi:hypothetical protein
MLNRLSSTALNDELRRPLDAIGVSDQSGEESRGNHLTTPPNRASNTVNFATGPSLFNNTGSTVSLKDFPLFTESLKARLYSAMGVHSENEIDVYKAIESQCCILF